MQTERRKFLRHPLQFQLEIRGDCRKGKPFSEKAQLINISGGGALFHPLEANQYYKGQVVEAMIILPGTPDMKGQMKTRATVVRLAQDGHGHAIVSVHFLDPFKLFRDEEAVNNEQDNHAKH